MPAINKVVKLVNRGPAGLLNKTKETVEGLRELKLVKNKISPALSMLVVDIAKLQHDPLNARLHPQGNLHSIKESLCQYGQVKPIVVRKGKNVVVAGNGTMQAAREMGWTKIAAVVIPMTDIEAAGYGLADNRTAELAKWNFEVVATIDKLLMEAGHNNIGWSQDELDALRGNDFTSPDAFPTVDENIEVEHVCPKCGYQFSGGQVVEKEE